MKSKILNHAKKCGETESCGFIIDNKTYLPCKNISPIPTENFEISPDDWIRAEDLGKITAIVHSHPNGLPILSMADQFFQQKTALDWWLVCDNKIHKFRYMQYLIGREFNHGIMDCYTLFRDAYHLCGLNFPNFVRENNWWDKGQELYLDNMSLNGFYQIQVSDIQIGDVILFMLNSKSANHAAIYVGNNSILHHLPKRLSKRDLFGGYWLNNYHSIWRHRKWRSLNFTAILNNMEINLK